MKPYLLVLHNLIRFTFRKMRVKGLSYGKVEMIGRNTKLSFHKSSSVSLGDRIVSDGRFVIVTGENASLSVGSRVYFNEGCMISCKSSVSIGSGCKFGPNVKIFDNNHCFDAENGVSDLHRAGTVEIGNNSWIGANCVILKGARIGKNCVIGAGCVVGGVIPDASIVTQNRELTVRPIG